MMNLVWLARTIIACYLLVWSHMTHERFTPGSRICPLNVIALHYLAKSLLPWFTRICFFLSVAFFIIHQHVCVAFAPHISALTIVILVSTIIEFTFRYTIWPLLRGETHASVTRPLTQTELDRIPLVHYIAPGPATTSPVPPIRWLSGCPLSPQSSTLSRKKNRRFTLFRSRTAYDYADSELSVWRMSPIDNVGPWGFIWDTAGLPCVLLADNLATCSICCSEFEAPPMLDEPSGSAVSEGEIEALERAAVQPAFEVNEVPVRMEPSRVNVDASDGSAVEGMPLGLLNCGHAFHKACIDRWLGRSKALCPNCRAPVRISSSKFGEGWGGRRGTV
uniref:RING-type domain-containing protein n=1 Tax=Trametes gibbosa TaxID=160864 RepID=A0A6G6FQH9_9APHY|nr:hypothetical protein [Trametes gibbosa]